MRVTQRKRGNDAVTVGLGCGLFVLLVAVGFAANTLMMYVVWNYAAAALFPVKSISWLQAFAATVIIWFVGTFFRSTSSK